jgi:adenylate cyclase
MLAVLALISGVLLRRWRPGLSLAITVVLGGLIFGASNWLFAAHAYFQPFAGAIGVVVTTYLVFGAIGFVAESRRRAEVRRAFTMYVAPEIVDHVLASPDRLKFGGENRTITVMFTDLAGFTTISEKHGPETVAKVLQQHFTRGSRIVKGRRGTLTQFIGDAIMAIWNAPLDDPEHAANACLAARELQADLAELRKELVAQGLPEIRMRIGLNTCEAVVGNLGAEDRFNYTGIGDGINLSARLEGANKAFGTGILVSGFTAALLPATMPLRRVARVIVKGKSEPVDVFTFEDDEGMRARTEEGIAAFAKQDWEGAEAIFRRIQSDYPGDGVAKHYLSRIAELRGTALEAGWDPAVALEKL